MTYRSLFSISLVGLALLGAGCTSAAPATPAVPTPEAPVSAPPPVPEAPAPEQPSATTSSNESVTKPSMTGETLAFPGVLPESETANLKVRIKTTKGDIVFELLPNEGPRAASNFVYLVKKNFYNNLTFHRVVPGFVIQGGDPLGNGTGGPGYQFADDPVKLSYKAGIVAMANAGPNTNGSQFFIMLENNPLPPSYSIFGNVVEGMDTVRKIGVGDVMTSVTLEKTK